MVSADLWMLSKHTYPETEQGWTEAASAAEGRARLPPDPILQLSISGLQRQCAAEARGCRGQKQLGTCIQGASVHPECAAARRHRKYCRTGLERHRHREPFPYSVGEEQVAAQEMDRETPEGPSEARQ